MVRPNYNDLQAFRVVAEERSFTRAAAQLGISPSALSQTIRTLEARLGVRLLTRTTRSVSATDAGEHMLTELGPAFDRINATVAAVSDFRELPSGTIRITAGDHPVETILWPALEQLLPAYPDIKVEIDVDNTLTDLAAGRYDAGIRLGEQVAKDMIAVRIGPDLRMAVVGSPAYLARRPAPKSPRELTGHECINLRLPTHDSIYAWELEKGHDILRVQVEGPLVFTRGDFIRKAALAGLGLAYLFEDHVRDDLVDGRLVRVLEDWCPPFPGYHLYYPSRRQSSRAFTLLVDTLRLRKIA
jgi:DNA-binding transcriptional LysR family regulator